MEQSTKVPFVVLILLLNHFTNIESQIGTNGERPKIVEGPEDLVVSKGDAAVMKCVVSGQPKPRVSWFKDGRKVDSNSNKFVIRSDGSLWFSKVKRSKRRSDEGVYFCVAKNMWGSAKSGNATLSVTYMNKRFRLNPTNMSVPAGKEVLFKCASPEGNPKPVVEWKKGQRFLRTGGRIQIYNVGDQDWLRISRVEKSDAGVYQCTAKNPSGVKDSLPAYLTVKVLPKVRVVPTSVVVYEGRHFDISCKTSGEPRPRVRWSKEKGDLPPVNRLVTLSEAKIRIEKVEKSDGGVYVCEATNSEGSSSASVNVKVKVRPYFLTRPTHLSVGLGQTAVLECEVRGEPSLRLFWQKLNGPSTVETLIFPKQQYDGRLTVMENGMLQIKNVQKRDGATYVCTVVSGPVTMAASARVTVIDNGVPPPSVSISPFNQTAMEGQNVTIICVAKGKPRPSVTWEFGANNEPITPMTEGVVLLQKDTEHTLTLKNVLKTDSGSYRCIASNAGGKQYKLAYVTVKVVPRAPSPPAYVDVLNITASTLVLRWKPPANPVEAPVTSYIIEFIDVDDSKDWQVLFSGVRSTEFQVVNLKSNTRYMFYVRAVNKVGPSRPSPVSRIITTRRSFLLPFTVTPPIRKVDKLLNVKLQLSLQPDSHSSIGLSWKSVKPASRIKGFYIYWRKHGIKDFERVTLEDNTRNSFILRNLQPDSLYEVSIQAFNDVYTSPMSDSASLKTMPEAPVDAPEDVTAIDNGKGGMLVVWKPPKRIPATEFLGYKIFCYSLNGKPVATGETRKNQTSYLLQGLEKGKRYSITVAARMIYGNGPGSRVYVTAGESGAGDFDNVNAGAKDSKKKHKRKEGFLAILKAPWFIAIIGVVLWLILFSVVIFIIYRRRKGKKAAGYGEQAKGLLGGNRRTDVGINRNRNSYRDSSFLWTPPSTGNEVSDSSLGNTSPGRPMRNCYRSLNGKKDDEFGKSEFNPLIGRQEVIEMKTAVRNGSLPKQAKNVNLKGGVDGYRTVPKETPLNNEISRKIDPRMKLADENYYSADEDKPRLRIQGAFDVTPLGQDGKDNRSVTDQAKDADKTNSSVRHAEIVRTATKKTFPDAELVNCMESNPLSTWKREKMKDAPHVLKEPGEDTLKRRAAKSPFKPLPKLEVLNWADSLPGPPSKPPSSAGSPPGSPKVMSSSASAFSENPGSRAPSRTSHGSSGSLNRFAHGPRSAHGQSMSSRRLSQSSSMLSSELYQSEMDPSVYSDAASEKKKPKPKAVPPPIDLDGLTSDILLQWAESVTNSSPSSSGSSSPSRLSGISSDGSFFTDEDFAQAVAAVVECGGFNIDFDYSLPGMPPGLPNNRVSTDSYKRRKMDKIDAFIAHKSSRPSTRNGPSSNMLSQYKSRPEAPSPAGVAPPMSLSGYLPGGSKRSASGSVSASAPAPAPGPPHVGSSKVKFKQPKLDQPPGLRYGPPDVESTVPSGTPLTMSNLREHDSSLERDRKGNAKPLTVSNLRQHESSLERVKRQHTSSPLERVDSPLREEDSIDQEIHGITNGIDCKRTPDVLIAKPLSVTSALERNESVGSRDSRSSVSEKGGKGTSERRRKKYVVNLKDPNSSTSTASTVRTSPDHTEC